MVLVKSPAVSAKYLALFTLTIGKALVGDFSGAIDEARGLLDGVKNVGIGAFSAMKGIGQAVYGAATDPEGAMKFGSAAWGSVKKGTSELFGFGGDATMPNGDGEGSPGLDGALAVPVLIKAVKKMKKVLMKKQKTL